MIAAGLLAASTAYVTTEKTAWATAYLVLIAGAAQIGLGESIIRLNPDPRPRRIWTTFVAWNLGNAGVIAGQLVALVAITDVGGVILVVALIAAIASAAVATPRGNDVGTTSPLDHARRLRATGRRAAAPWAFRGLIIILAVGIIVGLTLAQFT